MQYSAGKIGETSGDLENPSPFQINGGLSKPRSLTWVYGIFHLLHTGPVADDQPLVGVHGMEYIIESCYIYICRCRSEKSI